MVSGAAIALFYSCIAVIGAMSCAAFVAGVWKGL